jgi:hypothetical protein
MKVRWICALVMRLDEPRQLGGDLHGRAAGRIDEWQAKLPVFAPIVDGVGQAPRVGVLAEAAAPLLL